MANTVEALRKIVHKKSGSLAFAWLADLEAQAGDVDSAMDTLEEGLSSYPDFVPALMVKAKILSSQKKVAEAESCLQSVLSQDPMHLAAQLHLSLLYIEQKRGAEAQAIVHILKELDSLSPEIPSVPSNLLGADDSSIHLAAPESTSDLFIEKEALFASLEDAFLDGSEEETNEKSPSDLQNELEAALAGSVAEPAAPEFFPEDIPGEAGTVGSLFNQMFGAEEASQAPVTAAPGGLEESLVSAETIAPAVAETPIPPPLDTIASAPSPFSVFSAPPLAPVPPEPVAPEADLFEKSSQESIAPSSPIKSSESLSGGVDLASALDELFGEEDELPVERDASIAQAPVVSVPVEDKPAEPVSTSMDLTQGLADALGGMFGDADDLPVEKTASSSSFVAPEPAVAAELKGQVENALGDLFGEDDELPVEDASHTKLVDTSSVQESQSQQPTDLEAPAPTIDLKNDVADALGNLFSEPDELPVETEEPSRGATTMEEILGGAPQTSPEPEVDSSPLNIESLSDSLFEKSSDSSSLHDLLQSDAPETQLEGASLGGALGASLIENPNAPLMESAPEVSPVPKRDEDSFSGGMSNALTDLFGSELDEDLSDLMEDSSGATVQSTQTLAELYYSQGHFQEALQVYQGLQANDPANTEFADRIAELRSKLSDSSLS